MKKLLLIILVTLLFNSISFSQTKLPTIKSKSFTWEEKEQSKTFNLEFSYLLNDVSIPQDRLNMLVMNAIVKSKFKLKNKLTFKPLEVGFFNVISNSNNKEELFIIVKYTGKTDYGVEQLFKSYFVFKNEGEGTIEHSFTE
jgi:hypothetical protein